MKDAAVEARGFIAGCDRSVTLSGWLLGFCIIRDRDRIFVNARYKIRDRLTFKTVATRSGDRTTKARFALRYHRICCADRSRTIELPLVHQNLKLYNFYLLLPTTNF